MEYEFLASSELLVINTIVCCSSFSLLQRLLGSKFHGEKDKVFSTPRVLTASAEAAESEAAFYNRCRLKFENHWLEVAGCLGDCY